MRRSVVPLLCAMGLSVFSLGLTVLALPGCSKTNNVALGGGGGGGSGGATTPDEVPDSELAISGVVLDQSTGAALDKALVSAPELGQVFTNAQGQYLFLAADIPGLKAQTSLRVTASKDGYQSNWAQILVKDGHNRNVDIPLQRAASGSSYYVLTEPDALTFTEAGEKEVAVRIDTNTDATVSASIKVPIDAKGWLSVEPSEMTLSASAAYLTVKVDASSLTPKDTVKAELQITGGAKAKTIHVEFTAP